MPDVVSLEAKLDRVADNLVGVIQSLRLMSDMQRQQGEQLSQILTLLTPEETEPRADLGHLLRQLVAEVGEMGEEVRAVGHSFQRMGEMLPGQMAGAIGDALARAERGGQR